MSPETMTLLRTVINGRHVDLEIESRELLIDLLRERLELTGTKRSCDSQVCGACTVLLDGQPVSSCCTLAYEADGKTRPDHRRSGAGRSARSDSGSLRGACCHPVRVLHAGLCPDDQSDAG